MAATMQVDVHVTAFMNPYLPGYNNYSAVRHSCDMDCATDTTPDDKALGHVLNSEARES
jgi:hypothetical protein